MTNKLMPEWTKQDYVLLGWPHAATDWAYMLPEVTDCFTRIAAEIVKGARLIVPASDKAIVANALNGLVDMDRVTIIECPTNDTWARDFGPIAVHDTEGKAKLLDFKFNGWGLKFPACYDNLITRAVIKGLGWCHRYENRLGFVLEGGSIDIDDDGTLLSTEICLMSPNRNGELSKEQITQYIKEAFGASKVWWLSHGELEGDDTDGHIDTLARFLPGKKIAYCACDREDDSHFDELRLMRDEIASLAGDDYELVPLPIPHPIYDQDGIRLPATYANFLLLNHRLLLPVYGDKEYDQIAISRLGAALPDWEIVPIDCKALIQQHGSLHCVTMQLPNID